MQVKKEIPLQYDEKYWNSISIKYEKTAKIINTIRWSFVSFIKPKIVLDYGAGACFLSKFAPKGIIVDTFDIGKFPVKYTGIKHKRYDLIFLCDVLEHIPDFRVLDYQKKIFSRTKYIYVSVPILPKGKKLKNWKHFKFRTGEHLHFFTKESLDLFFEARNFARIKSGYPECRLRKDIYSAVYKKI